MSGDDGAQLLLVSSNGDDEHADAELFNIRMRRGRRAPGSIVLPGPSAAHTKFDQVVLFAEPIIRPSLDPRDNTNASQNDAVHACGHRPLTERSLFVKVENNFSQGPPAGYYELTAHPGWASAARRLSHERADATGVVQCLYPDDVYMTLTDKLGGVNAVSVAPTVVCAHEVVLHARVAEDPVPLSPPNELARRRSLYAAMRSARADVELGAEEARLGVLLQAHPPFPTNDERTHRSSNRVVRRMHRDRYGRSCRAAHIVAYIERQQSFVPAPILRSFIPPNSGPDSAWRDDVDRRVQWRYLCVRVGGMLVDGIDAVERLHREMLVNVRLFTAQA